MRFSVPTRGRMLDARQRVLPPIRRAVGFAADALRRLDAALADAGSQPEPASSEPEPKSPQGSPATDDPADLDEKVIAVREARQAAIAQRDAGLADRLTAVEDHLLHQVRSSRSAPLVSARDRLSGVARLEDIRKQLLANTPRPDGVEDDDDPEGR
ncbi:MAG: hypothetical protein GEU86_14150 [Actinophytocola sp.]|nr:hypothetical protein [Actinophytocola sp.]